MNIQTFMMLCLFFAGLCCGTVGVQAGNGTGTAEASEWEIGDGKRSDSAGERKWAETGEEMNLFMYEALGKHRLFPTKETQPGCLFVPMKSPEKDLRYTLCVWPAEIRFGDTVYFCVLRENLSEKAHLPKRELLAMAQEVHCRWIRDGIAQGETHTLLPECRMVTAGGEKEFPYGQTPEKTVFEATGSCWIPAGAWSVAASFVREFPALEEWKDDFWAEKDGELKLVVSEPGEEPELVSEAFTISVLPRPKAEMELLDQMYAEFPKERFPTEETVTLGPPQTTFGNYAVTPATEGDHLDRATECRFRISRETPVSAYSLQRCVLRVGMRKPEFALSPMDDAERIRLPGKFSGTLGHEIRLLCETERFLTFPASNLFREIFDAPFPQRVSFALRFLAWRPRTLEEFRRIRTTAEEAGISDEEKKALARLAWEWEEAVWELEKGFRLVSPYARSILIPKP